MRFEIPGAPVEFRGLQETLAKRVSEELDPYPPVSGEGASTIYVDVGFGFPRRFGEVHNTARDRWVTASDGSRLYLVLADRACAIPDLAGAPPLTFEVEPGFPVGPLLRTLLRPAIQLVLPHNGAVAIHGASVEWRGLGIVVAGWSESGKTEAALGLLENGARFISDKWTVLGSDGSLAPFPISVGIRRWVLAYTPLLRRALPAAARAQLLAAAGMSTLTRPLVRAGGSGRMRTVVAGALEDAVALGDRAALTPSQLSRVYGAVRPLMHAPLDVVVVLRTVPGTDVRVEAADADWAARRLARSASYERRMFFYLHRRARFAFVETASDAADEAEQREERLLRKLLSKRLVLEVSAPFPTDPRRVAVAIADHVL